MRCGSSKNSIENGSTSETGTPAGASLGGGAGPWSGGGACVTLMAMALPRKDAAADRSPERHADVVLGERCGRGDRARDQVQLRELALLVELARVLEAVQHGGHPPGEVLRPPHPPQRRFRVGRS